METLDGWVMANAVHVFRRCTRSKSSGRLGIEQLSCVACHNQIFVGRHDPSRNAGSGRRDTRATRGVGLPVKRNSDPSCVIAHARPYLSGMLADAAGEDNGINAWQA